MQADLGREVVAYLLFFLHILFDWGRIDNNGHFRFACLLTDSQEDFYIPYVSLTSASSPLGGCFDVDGPGFVTTSLCKFESVCLAFDFDFDARDDSGFSPLVTLFLRRRFGGSAFTASC